MTRTEYIAKRLCTDAYLTHPANAEVKGTNQMAPFFDGLDPLSQARMLEIASVVEFCISNFKDASPKEMIATIAANMAEVYNGVDEVFKHAPPDKWEDIRKTLTNQMQVPFEMYPKDLVEYYVGLAKAGYDACCTYGFDQKASETNFKKVSL